MPSHWTQIDLQKICRGPFKGPVVSVYLDLRTSTNFRGKAKSLFDRKTRDLKNTNFDEAGKKSAAANLEKVRKMISRDFSSEGASSMVIFASDGLWEVYKLPVVMDSKCVVDVMPYVRDLSSAMDRKKQYALLLLDRNHARLQTFYFGKFDQELLNIEEKVPQKVKHSGGQTMSGEMRGMQQGNRTAKVAGHIQFHLQQFLKKVSDETARLFQAGNFENFMIGGRKEVISEFKPMLNIRLQAALMGTFISSLKATPSGLAKKLSASVDEYEKGIEVSMLNTMIRANQPSRKAVLGVYPTLNALTLGEVHQLFIKDGMKSPSYVCLKDGMCDDHAKDCDICDQPMVKTADLANTLMNLGLRRGAKVKHVFFDHKIFDKHGVGAVLRYAL